MHGGTLTARSAGPGKGSEFTLTLPAPKNIENMTQPSHPIPPPVQPLVSTNPRRILIVDDNRDIAHGLARLLHRRGHAVSVAHDGPSALEEAADSRPDAFLLDLGLPGMDGYELVRELKARGFSDAIFIAVSGYAQKQDIETSRAAGFDHHVAKPVDINMLSRLIDEIASARTTVATGE
jgi:CheY-like chemotaxis protein